VGSKKQCKEQCGELRPRRSTKQRAEESPYRELDSQQAEPNMSFLNVRVVDHQDEPVTSTRVRIAIHHSVMPDTFLDDFTDHDGLAYFDFADAVSASVYVKGSKRLDHIHLNQVVQLPSKRIRVISSP
jgi:hypothetical protein